VAFFNFTAGQWWSATALKAWNIASQYGWVVVMQTPVKKSLGERHTTEP